MSLSLTPAAVRLVDGIPRTSSVDVAEHFGKQHKDVLKSIDRLDCSPEFNRRNFAPVSYIDAKNEYRRAVSMTRDGFVFLAMGYTGAKAAAFKEAYIAEFNRLEQAALQRLRDAVLDAHPDWQRLQRYDAAGLTNREVRLLLGWSEKRLRSARHAMAAAGLAPAARHRTQALSPAQRDRILDLTASGISYAETARRVGCGATTVRRLIANAGGAA